MPDKRMSMAATGYSDADMMFPMGDRPDLRRRSYHELNYPPHLGPNPLGDPPLLHPQFLHHHHPAAAAGPPMQHNFQVDMSLMTDDTFSLIRFVQALRSGSLDAPVSVFAVSVLFTQRPHI